MNINKICITKLFSDAILPIRSTSFSAGYDLHAYISRSRSIKVYSPANSLIKEIPETDGTYKLFSNQRALIPTGLSMACHQDYCIKIYPRSSSVSIGFTQPNCVGIVDADYRGEVHVLVHNISEETITISNGQRIGQMMLERVEPIEIELVDTLPDIDSTRGQGGFGSTGY